MSPASQSFRFRESRRLLREADVRLAVPGEDGEVSATTRDIATGGMFVSTPEPMPVGTTVHFVLQLGSEDEPAEVEGEATVVWVRSEAGGADQPAGMGMQFNRVEPPGEERLALLFSEEQTDGDVIPAAPVLEAEEDEDLDDEAEAPPEAVESEVPPRDALPDIDPPLAAREGAGDDEVDATLFGELTQDGEDDWMKPESRSRPWLWPAVGAAVLLVALVVFRGPLMRLVGVGGNPTEEATPAEAPSFEVSTLGAAAEAPPGALEAPPEALEAPPEAEEAPPEEVGDPSTASRLLVPLEEEMPTVTAEARAEPVATPPPARAEPAASPPPARAEPGASPSPARPPTAAPAAPPASATALRSITARTAGERTVIEIVGNAPFERHHVMPLEAPPRLLVRLIGVGQAYDATAVSAPRLRGVRTGVHGRGATRNLHVVLDLAAADIAATVERRGDRVVVNLSD
ncbi:MAG: PilZ domain-containing protein [Acidobacteria bacterium]|nr:PilZ domain-containing protein [Acidobacteriota bacterium]